MEHQTQTDG